MKNRILAMLLVVIMVVALVPANVFAAEAAPALPEAIATVTGRDITVTTMDGEEVPVTFTMNFHAVEPSDEQYEYYEKWYADYVLTVNKDVTGMDGYLIGQYDAANANWIKLAVETEDVIIKANEPFKVMYNLGQMINEKSTYISYEDIIKYVQDFDCGIYFTPEFLQNNPDLKVTLELRLYNLHNMDENYRIGDAYTFTAPNVPVEVVTQPTVTVAEDGTATFTVEATGSIKTYQWQREKTSGWVNASTESYVGNKTATMSTAVTGTYRCVITDYEGNKTITNAVTFEEVDQTVAVEITSQPKATVEEDGTVTFTCAATGSIKSYQWQRLKASGWVNATAENYFGNKTNTMNTAIEGTYRCVITDVEGNKTITNEVGSYVAVDASAKPTVTVGEDGTVTFTCNATGSIESYQWQRLKTAGWVNASATSYVGSKTSAMTTAVNGTFRCKITDSKGVVTYTSAVAFPVN